MKEFGGSGLLRDYYSDSIADAIMKVYPENPWQIWKFSSLPKGFARLYFDELSKKLGLKNKEDWYKVKFQDLTDLGAGPLLVHFGGSLIKSVK